MGDGGVRKASEGVWEQICILERLLRLKRGLGWIGEAYRESSNSWQGPGSEEEVRQEESWIAA